MTTNNPTQILTYATLSSAAYGKGALPMGWHLIQTSWGATSPSRD